MKIGLVGLLTLLFAAGKIFGFLSWSWFWVFCPIWISLILWVTVFGGVFLVGIGVVLVQTFWDSSFKR
jgi:hypothetical protein